MIKNPDMPNSNQLIMSVDLGNKNDFSYKDNLKTQNKIIRIVNSRQNDRKNPIDKQFGNSSENQFVGQRFIFNANQVNTNNNNIYFNENKGIKLKFFFN